MLKKISEYICIVKTPIRWWSACSVNYQYWRHIFNYSNIDEHFCMCFSPMLPVFTL